jgi:hypothetical protein
MSFWSEALGGCNPSVRYLDLKGTVRQRQEAKTRCLANPKRPEHALKSRCQRFWRDRHKRMSKPIANLDAESLLA